MGRGCSHNLNFQLVSQSLVVKGKDPSGSSQADLSKGNLNLSEAGVLVAVGFLLCTELSPGVR